MQKIPAEIAINLINLFCLKTRSNEIKYFVNLRVGNAKSLAMEVRWM